jgi:hypothetical protein
LLSGPGTSRSGWPLAGITGQQAFSISLPAVAEHHGAAILHYDADFEHIAAVTGQPHAWIVPRGSLA